MLFDISKFNKKCITKKTIFNNFKEYDLINYENIYDNLIIFKLNYIESIQKILVNNKNILRTCIKKDCPKEILSSLGLQFFINEYYQNNITYKLKFSGRVISKHNNLNFRLYNGNKWITFEDKISNEFNDFEVDIKMSPNFRKKYRINILNNDLYIENCINNENYIIEIKDVKMVDLDNFKEPDKTSYILNIYLYNLKYENYYGYIRRYFEKISEYGYIKVNLTELIPNEILFEDNDYLFLGDIFNKNEDYKPIFSKFKKENIIWFNYESPFIKTHKWWIDKLINDVGFIIGTYLKDGKKIENSFWTPARSLVMTYHNYLDKNIIINDNVFNKFITCNPFTHEGYGKCKFGNRNDIIQMLISKNLNVDIYGIQSLKNIYPNNYKGTIGECHALDSGITKINKLAEYKFIITIENHFLDGYITEKLSDVLLCNRLPIYFGYPNIKDILPNLFSNGVINGFDFDNLDDLIFFINNMSDEEYFKRIENIKKERENVFNLFNLNRTISYFFTKILNDKGIEIEYDNNISGIININNILSS